MMRGGVLPGPAPRRPPIPVADAGLQPERTSLAWTRTALAMMVCSMTLLRWSDAYPAVVLGAIALLAALGVAIIARNRHIYRDRAHALDRGHSPANTAAVLLTTAMMLVLGGIGLYLVVGV